ncbi:MAG TPA: Holliday junction resolvase RuvX, partial [Mycobacterium sp.]|nr:Holliday junction resolvase RuvX [Mycobacterium sp.]
KKRPAAASVPVRLVDERLSTVSAARDLHAAGMRSRRQRSVIDQAAAVTILQSWLDQRRALTAPAPTEDNGV